jgi:hypothetical protein
MASEGLDIVEGSAPSGAGNQEPDVVEGSAHSKTEEEPTRSFSVRGAENGGALAILDSSAPTIWKEKKGWLYTWTDWHHKAGAVGEKSPQEKTSHKKTKLSTAFRRKGGMPVGYSGRRALRREQCDIARQRLGKHIPMATNMQGNN